MFHKIKTFNAIDNYILEVIFEDNIIKYYDIMSLFDKWAVFNDLKSIPGLFNQVQVDLGGYGICWNDEIDLSCNELWNNGKNHL